MDRAMRELPLRVSLSDLVSEFYDLRGPLRWRGSPEARHAGGWMRRFCGWGCRARRRRGGGLLPTMEATFGECEEGEATLVSVANYIFITKFAP